MRRYDVVSGILLILSIIDFALAAPVLAQEKRQPFVDVVHIPKDVVTVLGKRWEEDLTKLWTKYFKKLANPESSSSSSSSSTTDSSSSSASSEADHGGSTNIVQAPAPDPASSTANAMWDDVWSYKANDELHGPLHSPSSSAYTSSGYSSDYEFTNAHAHAPQPNPNPNPRPSTDPAAGSGSESESESSTGPDPDFDWNYWMNSEDPPVTGPPGPPRLGPASPNEFGQAAHDGYYTQNQAEASSSTWLPNLQESQKEPAEYGGPHGPPPPSTELTNDPELHLPVDHQSSSLGAPDSDSDSQPEDLQAAIYAAKGKAKESRRISDRDTASLRDGCLGCGPA